MGVPQCHGSQPMQGHMDGISCQTQLKSDMSIPCLGTVSWEVVGYNHNIDKTRHNLSQRKIGFNEKTKYLTPFIQLGI
jgi:hypothetical protein